MISSRRHHSKTETMSSFKYPCWPPYLHLEHSSAHQSSPSIWVIEPRDVTKDLSWALFHWLRVDFAYSTICNFHASLIPYLLIPILPYRPTYYCRLTRFTSFTLIKNRTQPFWKSVKHALAIVKKQLMRVWAPVSRSVLQVGQISFTFTLLILEWSLVGRHLVEAHHNKFLIQVQYYFYPEL